MTMGWVLIEKRVRFVAGLISGLDSQRQEADGRYMEFIVSESVQQMRRQMMG